MEGPVRRARKGEDCGVRTKNSSRQRWLFWLNPRQSDIRAFETIWEGHSRWREPCEAKHAVKDSLKDA